MRPCKLRSFWVASLALFPLLACGCSKDGPRRAPVAGTVTLDGKPLKAGVVRFIPAGTAKGPVTAATVQDGMYALPADEGPVVGTNRIEIEAIDYLGFALDDEQAYVQNVEKKRGGPPPNPIPVRYNRQSKLTVEIASADNPALDFPLTTERR